MGNSYFEFKKFKVNQAKNAMKVCTDSCLFGSICHFPNLSKNELNIMDIGSGTGLLSLMTAQLNPNATITAIELDHESSVECQENFLQSPWANRLNCINTDILKYSATEDNQFDIIISNPPFFSNSQLSDNKSINRVRHISNLNYNLLLNITIKHLNNKGFALFLIGADSTHIFKNAIDQQKNIFTLQEIDIYNRPNSKLFRKIYKVAKQKNSSETNYSIYIRGDNNEYSPEFNILLSPFYLFL